jgi:hypothetical protein
MYDAYGFSVGSLKFHIARNVDIEKGMLNISIKTKPITKLLHFLRVPFLYVGGSNFRISAKIKNFGSEQFQGGVITIFVKYAFGNLTELIEMGVEKIDPEKEVTVNFKGHDVWGVLAQGHALFWVYVVDKANKFVDLCDDNGKPLQRQMDMEAVDDERLLKRVYRYHVHTFHSLGFGELCALIALFINTAAFITNIALVAMVNSEKLSVVWSTLIYSVPLSIIAILTIIVTVALWLVFVYVLYDRYGLYRKGPE